MNRGYKILYDINSYEDMIKRYVKPGHSNPEMAEEEFNNVVHDFYFHNIWAGKKLKRGELWSAKMCVDAYLKNYLLKMIEIYCFEKDGKDVWHDGRFIDYLIRGRFFRIQGGGNVLKVVPLILKYLLDYTC